ncbi:uncharacterized protein [Bemisia tabaci]|uniref:uncharacterized protein n=1 Tax=Bemisia tabaci TaxID=7038 RepID=UPI003B28BA23
MPQPRPFSPPVESDTPQPRPPFSTPLETKAPQLRNIPTPLGTKTPQPRPFSPPGAMETLQPRPVETEILQSGTSSTSVESEASTESGNFELLRAKYESQLKRIMVSELFDAERAPVEEGLLFKSDSGAGIVSNELDSLPGSKEDPNYWQPDVDRLLDSIKVAEMFRQISPELLWLGELRDHLISEAIHKRLRNTSGLSSDVIQFLYQVDNVNARDQTLIILRKILQTGDITEQKTVELAQRILGLLDSPRSRLSQIIARCTSIRYS